MVKSLESQLLEAKELVEGKFFTVNNVLYYVENIEIKEKEGYLIGTFISTSTGTNTSQKWPIILTIFKKYHGKTIFSSELAKVLYL